MLSLHSCTFGWSNGLMPSTRPATAVAYSQARNCAPSGPVDRRCRVGARRGAPTAHDARRRSAVASVPGRVGLSTTTGRMPVPSLPVDSAISCSAQSPRPTMPRAVVGERRACPGRPRPRRRAQPEARAPGCPRRRPSAGSQRRGLVEQRGHVDAGQRRRAPARTRSARCTARRRPGRRGRPRGSPRPARPLLQRRTRVGDDDEARAGSGRSRRPGTPARGARRWLSVSTVPPDLLSDHDDGAVEVGRRAPRAPGRGSVVSSTVSGTPGGRGRSPRAPATSRPCRPSTTWSRPSAAQLGAQRGQLGAAARGRLRDGSSQPSRISASASASGPHSVGVLRPAGRASRRRPLAASAGSPRRPARRAATATAHARQRRPGCGHAPAPLQLVRATTARAARPGILELLHALASSGSTTSS